MELFAISCTTCQARLKVRDMAALGKILACPKCQSMVQVTPPPGWRPPEPTSAQTAAIATSTAGTHSPGARAGAITDSLPTGLTIKVPAGVAAQVQAASKANVAKAAATKPATVPIPAPTSVPYEQINPNDIPPVPMAEPGESLASRLLAGAGRNRLVLITAPVAALVIALLAWIILRPDPVTGVPAPQVVLAAPAIDQADEQDAAATDNAATPADQITDAPVPPRDADDPPEAAVADSADAAPAATIAAPREDAAVDENAVTGKQGGTTTAADPGPEPANKLPAENLAAKGTPSQPANENSTRPAARQAPADHSSAGGASAKAGELEVTQPVAAATGEAEEDLLVAQESMPQVDVAARLADPLPSLQFKRTGLADFCDFIAKLSTVPITLDVEALAAAGVRVSDTVSISAEDTTVGDALAEVLAKRGLVYVTAGQQLLVTTPDRQAQALSTVKYDVHDLVSAGPGDEGQLGSLVARFVAPATWEERGGKARVTPGDGELIVEQHSLVERRIAAFLDKLRLARGLPAKGNSRPDAALASKYSRAKANLDAVVTANFALATPLADVLTWLARSTSTRILIDEVSLADAGLWSRSPASVVADHQPLHEVLSVLLAPVGMTYRIVDERTIQVFARRAVADRLEVELYPIEDLLARRLDPKELVARLRERLGQAAWSDGGGLGAIELDAGGKFLLVVQSPEAQVRLENLLVRATPTSRPAK
jgi:hypothetical protein